MLLILFYSLSRRGLWWAGGSLIHMTENQSTQKFQIDEQDHDDSELSLTSRGVLWNTGLVVGRNDRLLLMVYGHM